MNISEYCTKIPIKIERNSSKEVESFWKIIFYKLGQEPLQRIFQQYVSTKPGGSHVMP